MKFVARFILFLFVAFLSTPTIVTLIEKNTDVSMFYNCTEEENNHSHHAKEIKADLSHGFDYPFLEVAQPKKAKIVSENLARHDNIAEEIFIPPPERI